MSVRPLPIAYNLLRDQPHYRRDAFNQGLKACGYKVSYYVNGSITPDDVLVIWNRYNQNEIYARKFLAVGARVLVVENGYYDVKEKTYAISRNQHHHPVLPPEGGFFHMSRSKGDYILICAQRCIGSELMASPSVWEQKIADKLSKMTKREIRIRYHPGKNQPKTTVDQDLMGAHACVIWSSSCGINALLAAKPVIYDAPRWVAEESAIKWRDDLDVENLPEMPQSVGVNRALNNQFTIEQISSGEPIKRILSWQNI